MFWLFGQLVDPNIDMIAFKKPQSQGSSKKQYDTSKKNLASNGYLKIEACFSKNTNYKYKIFQCRLVQLI